MPLAESVARRLRSPDYDRWMGNAAATGYCHNPVRLVGSSTTLHEPTGEVLADYASSREPDGITFTRCGNRRAIRCASCSYEYKGDTWHMIMAGAAGGMKEVPEAVATHQ
ncbi:replication initiator [uncultured Microbacterium sp.]|uniref:replication initiator n=1 Tax=uncultured Microbacterium sp. TaxID=191216 RepID=UPI00345D38AF